MAKRRQFSEDATKRIAKVVRIVEHQRQNERPPDGKGHTPQTTWLNFATLGGTLVYQSTGVSATILTGAPPSRTAGTASVTVYGTLLGSSDVTVASGRTVLIGFVAGYWEAIGEPCT